MKKKHFFTPLIPPAVFYLLLFGVYLIHQVYDFAALPTAISLLGHFIIFVPIFCLFVFPIVSFCYSIRFLIKAPHPLWVALYRSGIFSVLSMTPIFILNQEWKIYAIGLPILWLWCLFWHLFPVLLFRLPTETPSAPPTDNLDSEN